MTPPTIQNNIPPNDNHERVQQQPEPVQEQHQVLPLRCLWKPTTIGVPVIVDDTTTTTTIEENSTRCCTTLDSIETTTIPIPLLLLLSNYDDIYHHYCIQQHSISFNLEMNHHHSVTNRTTHQRPTVLPPVRHSLFRSIAHALLVVQEFILVTYFGAWYRIILLTTTTTTTTSTTTTPSIWIHDTTQQQQFYIDISMIFMYIALLLAVLCNARATSVMETLPKSSSTTKTSYPPYNYYYSKVLYRLIDATILAGLVRYIAVVLRNLTASYSTDTVERLAVGAMFVHVLCCDYTYANGYNENTTTDYRRRRRRKLQRPRPHQQQHTTTFNGHAPNISTHNATKISSTFMGGTISLNAAFFATIVLVSRFDCNTTTTTIIQTSTTNTTFIFLSLAVILFAFYPVTRHTISIVYPSHQSGTSFVSSIVTWMS